MALEKSHEAGRTIAEWVLWAQNEGFEDIVEWCEGDGATQLYCKLCAKKVTATSKCIKSHCLGYQVGTGENKTFKESVHAKKVW